jgi:5,10-methylenetetrahydromethanopterin reductase
MMLGSGFGLDVVESARQRIAAGAADAGRDRGSIDVIVAGIIYVSEDGETARKRARRRIANRAHHNFRLSLESVPETEREGVRRFMEPFDISKPNEDRMPAGLVSDYLVRRFAIAGTPAECIERVRELRSMGVDGFLVTPPEYAWEEVARLWAAEVMPHVA